MEFPPWVKDPYFFRGILLPGFVIFALATAFFPDVVDDATRNVSIATSRSDLTLFVWLSWAVAIGLVFHIFWRFVYFLTRPRPHPGLLIGQLLERAGAPAPNAFERRALYEILAARAKESPGAASLARERALVQSSYQAALALSIVGAFLAVFHAPSQLVSAEHGLLQGIVFVAAGACLFLWVRLRDIVLHRAELASLKLNEPETVAFLQGAWSNLWSARTPGPPAPVAPPPKA